MLDYPRVRRSGAFEMTKVVPGWRGEDGDLARRDPRRTPAVELAALCGSAAYVTSALRKHTGVEVFRDYPGHDRRGRARLCLRRDADVDALRGVCLGPGTRPVFIEKPLCLDAAQSKQLADLARAQWRVMKSVSHNRFIETFRGARRIVGAGALGDIYHVSGSAFGQVVVRPKSGFTWGPEARRRPLLAGLCLARHRPDERHCGSPANVVSAAAQRFFRDRERGLCAVCLPRRRKRASSKPNWSDDTYRKMATTLVVYGKKGKIVADRQELRGHLRPRRRVRA
jgi:scyllo-inositol 2-dehydrogenase (NADP+)